MLEDSGKLGTSAPRRKRRRVQSRAVPPKDIWERSGNEIELGNSKRRRKRKKGGKAFLQIFVFLIIGLSIPFGVKWAQERYVLSETGPKLEHIAVRTDGALSDDLIIRQSGLEKGSLLRRIDLTGIEAEVAKIPRVKNVKVEVQYPDSVTISITERVEVAWLSCPNHQVRPLRENGMLIDRYGVALRCDQLNEDLMLLPTIEIANVAAPREGIPIQSDQLFCALELVETGKQLEKDFGIRLIDVRPLNNWGLLCHFSGDLLATFHIDRIEDGLDNFKAILGETHDDKRKLATVNLAVMKNIPVTFHSKPAP